MVGFQIIVNGKPAQTIGIGEQGMLNATVEWVCLPTKTSIHKHLWIRLNGMPVKDREVSDRLGTHWPIIPLNVGDEVTIRAIETESIDSPLPGLPDFEEAYKQSNV